MEETINFGDVVQVQSESNRDKWKLAIVDNFIFSSINKLYPLQVWTERIVVICCDDLHSFHTISLHGFNNFAVPEFFCNLACYSLSAILNGILNVECAVRPLGISVAATPEEASSIAICRTLFIEICIFILLKCRCIHF